MIYRYNKYEICYRKLKNNHNIKNYIDFILYHVLNYYSILNE